MARDLRSGVAASARQSFDTGRLERGLRGSERSARTETEIATATRAALTGAGVSCTLTTSTEIGQLENGGYLYEAACANGPGFLVTDGETTEAFDCLKLASSHQLNPPAEGETGTLCRLPANQDRAAMVAPVANAAGVPCKVDNALFMGETGDAKGRYEIGCEGADGYWVDIDAAGTATRTSCLTVTANEGACIYTNPEEQLATIRTRFAGADQTDCTIEQGRGVGATPTSEFYEVKCAGGQGYMVRASLAGEFEQLYACAEADGIAGGCKLTDLSALRSSLSERRKAQLNSVGVSCTSTSEIKIGQERGEDGREVVEFGCAELPLGLIAYLPAEGNDDVLVQDCIAATLRGVVCQTTPVETVRAALTASLKAGGTECAVTEFKSKGSLGEGVGDSVEVKCADGSGYLADVPANRNAPSSARPCAGLPASEQCRL
ncbi:MAG: hypothetical protein SWI22_10385 [Pseudomonadota bacterium]|nr:hypothetical protein [Pseudomonadota bacterium]